MSNLSKAQRDKLAADVFALPKQRLYPILDQSDADDAVSLVGKHPEAKPDIIRRIKALKLKMPDAWQTADMSASPEMVIKRGKIFEAGDYPDKRLSITPEEMFAAVENFAPKPVRDTHIARETSLLHGKFGTVQSIALDPENPYDLIGEVAIPKWLDEALAGTDISVSAEWNRQTKDFEGLALLTDPQIEDAAIFAAFAKSVHNTPEGQSAIQGIHDMASRAGAVCDDPATWSAKHEVNAIQQIHDIAQDNGAHCAAMPPGKSGSASPAWYSQGTEDADKAAGNAVLFSTGNNRRARMSFGERFKAWFTSGMVGDLPLADEPATPTPAAPAAFSAGTDPETVALKAEVARLKAERIESGAQAFFASEYAEHRVYPIERDEVLDEYRRAAIDDAEHGLATFSGSDKTSRVEALKKRYAARPAHSLTLEQLKPDELAEFMKSPLVNQMTTPQAGTAAPVAPERKEQLLKMTTVGRSVIEGRNGSGRN